MAGTSLIWLWLVRLQGWRSNKTKTCRQGRGKEGNLEWFYFWYQNFDKITTKAGFSPVNSQSFTDSPWRMTSPNMLLHSLGELHKGPSWMTRGERMRTTLVLTLGGGGSDWWTSRWTRRWSAELLEKNFVESSCNMKTSRGGGIAIVDFFGKLVAQQQLLWCDLGPWRWQAWKGSQNSTLHSQHFLLNDNQRRLGWIIT